LLSFKTLAALDAMSSVALLGIPRTLWSAIFASVFSMKLYAALQTNPLGRRNGTTLFNTFHSICG
jgi:hypothetical protein